jgi:hypothetical protein
VIQPSCRLLPHRGVVVCRTSSCFVCRMYRARCAACRCMCGAIEGGASAPRLRRKRRETKDNGERCKWVTVTVSVELVVLDVAVLTRALGRLRVWGSSCRPASEGIEPNRASAIGWTHVEIGWRRVSAEVFRLSSLYSNAPCRCLGRSCLRVVYFRVLGIERRGGSSVERVGDTAVAARNRYQSNDESRFERTGSRVGRRLDEG